MSELRGRLARQPIRWRLALTSAGLTLAILLLFAVVIGLFTAGQLRSDFEGDLRAAAADLQERLRVHSTVFGGLRLDARADIVDVAGSGDAAIRVVDGGGGVLAQTSDAPNLGPPLDTATDVGDWLVVSRPLFGSTTIGRPLAYVQYAKPKASVDATIARVWLFLGLGVLGGAGLALLAGLAVARRAMAPIGDLTSAAREVARTRDPGTRLPAPTAEDEVADLSRTLEEMLMALEAARTETEGMLARQRQFVADASHELRSPLTSVLTNLEVLEAELAGEDAEIARSALRSARRMRRLVADLLLLAADAGQRSAREATDLGVVLRGAAAEVAPLTAGHDVSVDAPSGLRVEGSSDDLHRLAINLLENAVAHTPSGTSVRASIRREDGSAVLEVADDGPGVPEELRERIFDRFVRGASSGTRGGRPGSGLGLAIVSAVAEGHGGSVTLAPAGNEDAEAGEETPRSGARFVVRLPLLEDARTTAPHEAQSGEATARLGGQPGRRSSTSAWIE